MYVYQQQIQYHRSMDTRIYKTDTQFLAALGSWGRREKKKLQTAIIMLLLRSVFLCVHGQKSFIFIFFKYCSVRTKKLHKMKVRKIWIFS